MAKKEKTKFVGIHDDEGILTGYETAPIDDPRIEIPERDLEPGRYRFDAADGVYMPLPKKGGKDETTPGALAAIAKGFVYLANNEIPVPLETLKWASEYLSSTDARANFDKDFKQ